MNLDPKASWLRLARRHAERARNSNYWHVAIVRKGGKILSIGVNHDTTHAEVAAMRLCNEDALRNSEILSLRFALSGRLSMAKPCQACTHALRSAGIKRVIYSVPFDQLERMSLAG